jgi:SAM-dependent methyltransferase
MNADYLFPLFYHAQHQNYLEDLPFWLGLAASQVTPILELGCGSGRVLLPLAMANHLVVGIDNDAGMLAVLKTRLTPEMQAGISLLLADITRMPLSERYSLIVMPCNTLSTLTSQAQADVLGEVRSHLAQHGLFAVSLPNPELLRRMPRQSEPEIEDTFSHPLIGEPVQVSSGWKKTSDYLMVTWHYDHLLPDGGVKRLTSQVRHRLDSVRDYLEAFSAAGLQVEHLYGDFDGSAYQADSESLIILARPAAF